MKTYMLIIPLAGVVAFAAAVQAEDTADVVAAPTNSPVVVAQTNAAPQTTISETTLGEGLVRSGAITAKPPQAGGSAVWAAINPFAPMQPVPETPWLSRVAWGTAAAKPASPAFRDASRHESQMSVVIYSR